MSTEPASTSVATASSLSSSMLGPANLDKVVLHHLKTSREIESILHLRDGIDLSTHTAMGADEFHRLEKKGTNADLSAPLSLREKLLEPSASCRWDRGSP